MLVIQFDDFIFFKILSQHRNEQLCFSDACGGLIDTSNGTITSPSFPDLYPANKNCIWEILAPPQWRITVNFTHFDIEGNNVGRIDVSKFQIN